MVVAAIAEQHDIGDLVFAEHPPESFGPVGQRSKIINGVGQTPIESVAAIEIDFENLVAGIPQPLAKFPEEGAHEALKQHHTARLRWLREHL